MHCIYMHHGMFTFVCLVYTMYTTMLSVFFFLFFSEELSRKKSAKSTHPSIQLIRNAVNCVPVHIYACSCSVVFSVHDYLCVCLICQIQVCLYNIRPKKVKRKIIETIMYTIDLSKKTVTRHSITK